MIKERQISINGLKVNYKIAGKGMPFLILHGWMGSSNSWIKVQKILAKEGFKVIVPDLPGFGKSQTPPIPWGQKDYSSFILSFIKKLGLNKIILMGHSFGGGLAIEFATSHPERLKILILCDSARIKHKLNFYQKIVFNLARVGNFLFSKSPLRRFQDLARNIFYYLIRKKDYTKVKGVMRQIFKKIVNVDLTPKLSQIKVKTLIVWGEKDKCTPLEDAYLMKEKILNSTLKIIPRASHTPNLEYPEKLAKVILNFLKSENRAL